MKTVNVAEARSRLKALLDEVSSVRRYRWSGVDERLPDWFLRPRGNDGCRLLGSFRASIRVTGEPVSRTVVRARRNARY